MHGPQAAPWHQGDWGRVLDGCAGRKLPLCAVHCMDHVVVPLSAVRRAAHAGVVRRVVCERCV
eukprot:3519481-Prymnesium_polylepis.1